MLRDTVAHYQRAPHQFTRHVKLQRKDRIDKLGALVLVSFSALLGLNQVLIKLVNVGMQPVFQAGLRSVCAFVPVFLFALLTGKALNLRDGSLLPGVLAGLLFAFEFTFLFIALDYTSVARASVLFYTCLLYTSPSPRDQRGSRMPSSA